MMYPTINGGIVNRSLVLAAEDFLSRVDVSPYRGKDVVMEFTRPTEPEDELYREHPALWVEVSTYNAGLFEERQADLVDAAAYAAPSILLPDYGLPDEIFGVISIPSIDLEMPLYLGASPEHMADGAAVLTETSIPIGGTNSNAVIAGHRGWNGASYFLHVPDLKNGDTIYLTNLWETLIYKVVGTKIIDPNDFETILIQEGKDMITLLTCHPPASGGKQRFLVFCERSK